MRTSQWKTHCEELTRQFEAERLEYAEQIFVKERDTDEFSEKFIEASAGGGMGQLVERGSYGQE